MSPALLFSYDFSIGCPMDLIKPIPNYIPFEQCGHTESPHSLKKWHLFMKDALQGAMIEFAQMDPTDTSDTFSR